MKTDKSKKRKNSACSENSSASPSPSPEDGDKRPRKASNHEKRPKERGDSGLERSERDRSNADRNRHTERRGDRDTHVERHRERRNEDRERRDEDRGKKLRNYHRNDNRRERRSREASPRNHRRNEQRHNPRNRRGRSRSGSFDHGNAKWGKSHQADEKQKKPQDREKPNFALSGKLTEERNTFKGVVIKYSEPPEARKPKRRWRLYPFKGEKALQTLYIHRDSAYLIGRERKVVDLPVDHPSCSKQHAVLQYRLVPFIREDGSQGKRVRPYLIDLESANGTFINNKKIDAKKYVELLERDVIKFGFSSREYVLLHENSKDEKLDDDVKLEDEESTVKEEPDQ